MPKTTDGSCATNLKSSNGIMAGQSTTSSADTERLWKTLSGNNERMSTISSDNTERLLTICDSS